jgi:hypothetical protein
MAVLMDASVSSLIAASATAEADVQQMQSGKGFISARPSAVGGGKLQGQVRKRFGGDIKKRKVSGRMIGNLGNVTVDVMNGTLMTRVHGISLIQVSVLNTLYAIYMYCSVVVIVDKSNWRLCRYTVIKLGITNLGRRNLICK